MMRMMLARFVNDDRRIDRLMIVTMLITCVAVTGLVAYTSFSPAEDGAPRYSGLNQDAPLVLRGAVIAQGDGGQVHAVSFPVAIPQGGEPVNLTAPPGNTVEISCADDRHQADDLAWAAVRIGPGDGDNMLEAGETFRIEVETPHMESGATFTIRVRTPEGKTLDIERTLPAKSEQVMNLR